MLRSIRLALCAMLALGMGASTGPAAPPLVRGVQFSDTFQIDSRADYEIEGDVEWRPGALLVHEHGSIAADKRMANPFQFDFDLKLLKFSQRGRIDTNLRLALTNRGFLAITIRRAVTPEGQIIRQVIVADSIHRDLGLDPPPPRRWQRLAMCEPFKDAKTIERWSVRNNFGQLEIYCNGRFVGRTYSDVFSLWHRRVTFSQQQGGVAVASLFLSGQPAGYTEAQTKVYQEHQARLNALNHARTVDDLQKGITRYEAVLPQMIEVFGEDDIVLPTSYMNLANAWNWTGDSAKEQAYRDKAIAAFERLFGADHPYLLQARVLRYSVVEDPAELQHAIDEVLQATESVVAAAGESNPFAVDLRQRSLAAVQRLASQSLTAGDLQAHEAAMQQAAELAFDVFGPMSLLPEYLAVTTQLAGQLTAAPPSERAEMLEFYQLWTAVTTSQLQGPSGARKAKVEQFVERSKALFGEQHLVAAESLRALGLFQSSQGNLGKAIQTTRAMAEAYKNAAGEESWEYARALGELGYTMVGSEHAVEAEALLIEALGILDKIDAAHTSTYANLLVTLARLEINSGRLDAAQQRLERAIAILEQRPSGDRGSLLVAWERLVDVHRARQDLAAVQQSTAQLTECILNQGLPDAGDQCLLLLNEAANLILTLQFDESAEKYRTARAIAQQAFGRKSPYYSVAVDGLIKVESYRNNPAGIVENLKEHLTLARWRRESQFVNYSEWEQLRANVVGRMGLDLLMILTRDKHVAAGEAYQYVLKSKGAVTQFQRRMRLVATDPHLQPLAEQLREASARLATLVAASDVQLESDEVAEAIREKQAVEQQLAAASADYRGVVAEVDVAAVKDALPDDAALVDYVAYWDLGSTAWADPALQLGAFVVRPGRDVEFVPLGDAEPVIQRLLTWAIAMTKEEFAALADQWTPALANEVDLAGERMRNAVWDPLAKHLQGTKLVVLCPDNFLARCPFAALPVGSPPTYLIEHKRIALTLSAQAFVNDLNQPTSEPADRFVLVHNVDYGEFSPASVEDVDSDYAPFHPLGDDSARVERLAALFRQQHAGGAVEVLSGRGANEEAFAAAVGDGDFIYLDTHGFFMNRKDVAALRSAPSLDDEDDEDDEDPELEIDLYLAGIALADANSGIATSRPDDGVLWADEIASLNLSDADLVVLAACESSLGQFSATEGMLGCQRALRVAGARSTVTTIWSVQTKATAEFMERFYVSLWERQAGRAEALQDAMVFMLRDYQGDDGDAPWTGRTPPGVWAGFVLHGDWR